MARGSGDQKDAAQWRHRIKMNKDYLEDCLGSLNAIADILIARHIFSSDDADFVEHGGKDGTAKAKNRRFLQRLIEKGPEAYKPFTEALNETCHQHVVDVLESTDMSSVTDLSSAPLAADKTDGGTEAASGQASGHTQPTINIQYAHKVFIGGQNPADMFNPDTASSEKGVTGEDYLVILIKEELEQCSERKEALHTLEQKICDKISTHEKKCFSFKKRLRLSFKQFIEKKANEFELENDGQHFVVSVKKVKKKKGKKKAQDKVVESLQSAGGSKFYVINDLPIQSPVLEEKMHNHDGEDEGGCETGETSDWQTVCRKRGVRAIGRMKESSTSVGTAPHEKGLSLSATSTADEVLILGLIQQPASDVLIFKSSDEVYKHDRVEFIKDVTSLYNTSNAKSPAYIILGVEVCSSLPHRLQGLQSSTGESDYQSMFPQTLFSVTPKFRCREVICKGKRIGIIEVENQSSCNSKSVIRSDDMAASGLKKNQLWSREQGRNVCRAYEEPSQGKLCQPSRKKQKGKQGKKPSETPFSPERASKQSSAKPSRQVHQTPAGNSSSDPEVFSKQTYAQKLQEQAPESASSEKVKAPARVLSKAKELMTALNNFKKFDFVLVTGSMRITNYNIQALASAPWVAVYDFSFHGRDTNGLLGMLEEDIGKRRSLSIFTWCDKCKGITEKGTQWWSLRGRREIVDSHPPDDHDEWCRKVKDKLEKLSQELAQFANDCTVLKVFILWPDSEVEGRCMHLFLQKLQENFPSEMILCFPDSTKDYSQSKAVKLISLQYEESIQEFHVDLQDFCSEVELLTESTTSAEKKQFQLPSTDSKVVTLSEKDNAWLVEDLDVLYLQNPCSEALTDEGLQDEANTFFKGGAIKWSTLYDPRYDHFDIKRAVSKDIIRYVDMEFIRDSRNGMMMIYHAPGAGGSTLARRILWDIHSQAPCVQVKQRSGSSVEEIAAKLIFLYDKCRVPVIALMDGEDESRIKQFSRQLQRHNVVIVYVKRYPYDYSRGSKGKFYLAGTVESKESKDLRIRYMDQCQDDQTKIAALQKLDKKVQRGETVHMYEYGMTVYLHEFQGVRAFVRGHLQLEEQCQGDLQQWQKCLGFLALVYFYGHSSLPCQFFVSLLGKMSNYKVELNDFPNQVKVFVVQDNNEGREQCIRIGHYIIAKEILEHVLCKRIRKPSGKDDKFGDSLSLEARRHLKDFCIDFISQATNRKLKTSLASQTITHILTKTFIFRDNEEISEMNDQKKKPQFSQIMSDLDSDPPYQGRLEILQKLCATFPHDPNFRAHLGRFYTCCHPEKEKEAEKHFKEALKLCREQSSSKDVSETDDKFKLTLMHIYHMYGMFFQVRLDKLTKTYAEFHKNTGRVTEEILEKIVGDADNACENFVNSRNCTPAGYEESYIYTNEIFVRLRTCDFVHRFFPGKLKTFLAEDDGSMSSIRSFVIQSVTEIDNLIMECHDVQVDDVLQLQTYAQWFHYLFSSCSMQLQRLLRNDRLGNLRLTITATKLKFRRKDDIIWTDSPIPEREITYLVNLLEDIFKEECVDDRNKTKVKLDLDYRDWILAIRHFHFPQEYEVEKVLGRVREWHDLCHSPLSTYYLFVLLSLLGFGTASCPGNTECLVEAQMCLEPMKKLSKVIQKSRFPREWLGTEDIPGIKRLVTNSNVSHEDRRIKYSTRTKLAVCKGTICAKLQKPAGFIDLDLGITTTPVKVFFVPARAENVEPHRDTGARVQFHLAFTLDKGYEAYEVKLLNRYRCYNCPQRVEMTWEQQEVQCKNCRAMVTKNEHSIDTRTALQTEDQ